MTPSLRLILEAQSAVRDWRSPAARDVAAREAAAISMHEDAHNCDEGKAHIFTAIRCAMMALAFAEDGRAEVLAEAIRALVKAARAEPIAPRQNSTVDAAPRRYWVEA